MNNHLKTIARDVTESFKLISPAWPLKSAIAVNPLGGLEGMPMHEAWRLGRAYFELDTIPEPLRNVNIACIKWLQVFFEEGQASIPMPLRSNGLYAAWRALAPYDDILHQRDKRKKFDLANLPESPEEAIAQGLQALGIQAHEQLAFFKSVLTTLPGWSAYIQYQTTRAASNVHPITQMDYLAVRLTIIRMFWAEAKDWFLHHERSHVSVCGHDERYLQMQARENAYREHLLGAIAKHKPALLSSPKAQWVFCIDVRSEPFRRALESIGDHETIGFAGFFGLPIAIKQAFTGKVTSSCPVLLKPKHEVNEVIVSPHQHRRYAVSAMLTQLYQSVKYTFTAPLGLVESVGFISACALILRSLVPGCVQLIKSVFDHSAHQADAHQPQCDAIPEGDQCDYAYHALKMMGLTQHFAPLVVFCGHGSETENNAFAAQLDCGACGGRPGGSNARLLAKLLNDESLRAILHERGIIIPKATRFIAAEHNTTTDDVILFEAAHEPAVAELKRDLAEARTINQGYRIHALKPKVKRHQLPNQFKRRSQDWSEVRPEWGLARNAAFIVGSRQLTRGLDLGGRCFLHSYDHTKDPDGEYLASILKAPMVVAQWINMQYLFSTLNNRAYGGGSKVTKNITGKIGVMQGNASDLMTGLPLQSVFRHDLQPYHEPQRLLVVVCAPILSLSNIIAKEPLLQRLFGNAWVHLVCMDPERGDISMLRTDLTWDKVTLA